MKHIKHRSLLLWGQGLIHLVQIFYLSSPCFVVTCWKTKLRRARCFPSTYTFPRFCEKSVVYLKLPFTLTNVHSHAVSSSFSYVGATSISLNKREANRVAKLRQVRCAKLVKTELAIRWWHQKKNYFLFSSLVLHVCKDQSEAFALEHAYLSAWKPKLNFPYISSHLKFKALGFAKVRCRSKQPMLFHGMRLFKKVRHRALKPNKPKRLVMSQVQAWTLLIDLGSNTIRSFLASKHIRSLSVSPDCLYALFRLAGNLEEPGRSRVKGLLASALKFRCLSIPRPHKPITLPFLSHPSFQQELKQFLALKVLKLRRHCLPFHLPSPAPREGAHDKISNNLFNFKRWLEWISKKADHQVVPCKCRSFQGKLSPEDFVDSHVVCSASKLLRNPELIQVASASVTLTFYPAKHFYFQIALNNFEAWLKHHGLPCLSREDFSDFLEVQWLEHLHHSAHAQLFTAPCVFKIKQILSESWILHIADKEPGHLIAYCPYLYVDTMRSTWNDVSVFEHVDMAPDFLPSYFMDKCPLKIRKRYSWGISPSAQPPYGYGLLKRKKKFKVARTIISYAFTAFAKLLRATSIILEDILSTTWPDLLGLDKAPVIWNKLHAFLANMDDDEDYTVINDDLVGFFNAIPQERIIDSVHDLLSDFFAMRCNRQQFDQVQMSVNLSKLVHHNRVFQGKVRSLNKLNFKSLFLADIPDLVQLSFDSGVFTALGTCYRQIRGSSIGNQISPILSAISIAKYERTWKQSFSAWLTLNQQALFLTRYVDNRFCILPRRFLTHHAICDFSMEDFYGSPVLLERVPDDTDLLGFEVNLLKQTALYRMPQQSWQFRSPNAAGSVRILLSGLRARAALIRQQTWPSSMVEPTLHRLCAQYVSLGFKSSDVSNQVFRKRKTIVCP